MIWDDLEEAIKNKTWLVHDGTKLVQIVDWHADAWDENDRVWRTTHDDFPYACDLRLATAKDMMELSND